jgi:hypothetical protein
MKRFPDYRQYDGLSLSELRCFKLNSIFYRLYNTIISYAVEARHYRKLR